MSFRRESPPIPTIVYCRHASMSRVRRWVWRSAHRPTWLSKPSAPITTLARTSNVSPMCSHRAPSTVPSSRRSPIALVLIRISAPALAASLARWRSNRSRSRTYPHSFPARVSSRTSAVPSGAMTRAPSTSWQMNPFDGSRPISSSHRFATPSPQRTGVPISDRFSIRRTSAPPSDAYFAAVLPVGPAPTTRTSTSRSIPTGPSCLALMRLCPGIPATTEGASNGMPVRSNTYLSARIRIRGHGDGDPQGPEARVFEPRYLAAEALGGVEREPTRIAAEPRGRGRWLAADPPRAVRGVPDPGGGVGRCGRVGVVGGGDAHDHRQLHRRLQHDPREEPRGVVARPAARDPRGGPRTHRPHDRESGPEVCDDREFRRANPVPDRRSLATPALPHLPHGEDRAGCAGRRRGRNARRDRPDGDGGRPPVLARRPAAPARGAEPDGRGEDRRHRAPASPRRSRGRGQP